MPGKTDTASRTYALTVQAYVRYPLFTILTTASPVILFPPL